MGTSGENSTRVKNIGVSWLDDGDGELADDGGSSKFSSMARFCDEDVIASVGSSLCESEQESSKLYEVDEISQCLGNLHSELATKQ